jgi:hypothetical protein
MSSGNLWLKYSQSGEKNSHAYLLNFCELGIGQWATGIKDAQFLMRE